MTTKAYSSQSKNVTKYCVFHATFSMFGTLGKMTRGSGLAEPVIESAIRANESLDQSL